MESLDAILKKYYLTKVESSDLTNIIGWRVIGARTVDVNDINHHVWVELETDPEVWIKCFRFKLLLGQNEFIMLADPDCPEAYYLDNEFMDPMIKEMSQALLLESNTLSILNNPSTFTLNSYYGNGIIYDNTSTLSNYCGNGTYGNTTTYAMTYNPSANQFVITNSSLC